MASANFLEEALNTDVDESAVNAIVGSLENQLGTASPHVQQPPNAGLQQNHVNSAISNGGTASSAPQKHGTMANGDSISASVSNVADKQMNNSGYMNASAQSAITSTYSLDQKPPEGVKIVYTQGGQVMGAQGAVLQQRPPQGQIPNGTINMAPQTVCFCFVCILIYFHVQQWYPNQICPYNNTQLSHCFLQLYKKLTNDGKTLKIKSLIEL